MTKVLTRDEILSAPDIKIEEVDMPEWGGIVRIKTMSAEDKEKLEVSIVGETGEKRDTTNLRAKVVALSVVGEDGQLLFGIESAPELAKKSAKAIDRIFPVAQRLSGLQTREMETLTKNSLPGQGEDSTSG